MSGRKVLDSYALIAFFEGERGADKVGALIAHARDSGKPLLMSVVNWGEVYYIRYRTAGREAAEAAIQAIDTLPIEIVPADRELSRLAAEFKATRKMSYGDCFAAGLAKLKKADIVTGNKEFREVEESGIKILWLS